MIQIEKNGSFLLTGSSNVLDHKDSKDSLAGRLCELKLLPLSSKEKNDKPNENIYLAIEVKQSSSVKKDDFKHIMDLQNKIDKKCLGIVFYNGDMVVEFSDDLVAIPFGVFL